MQKNRYLFILKILMSVCFAMLLSVSSRIANAAELSGKIDSVAIIAQGSPQVGRTLYAEVKVNGKIVENDFYSNLKFSWKIENGKNTNAFKEISNAIKNTYNIAESDAGLRIKVVVTGVGSVTGTGESVTELAVSDSKVRINFDGNGADSGNVLGSEQLYVGHEYILPRNSTNLIKSGSVFAGWMSDDGRLYRPDAAYTLSSDTIFKAVWMNRDENLLSLGNGDIRINPAGERKQANSIQDKTVPNIFEFNDRPGSTEFNASIYLLDDREVTLEAISGCKVEPVQRTDENAGKYIEYRVAYASEDTFASSTTKIKVTVKAPSGQSKEYELHAKRPESIPLREMGIYDRATGNGYDFTQVTEIDYEARVTKDVRNICIEVAPDNLFYKAYITTAKKLRHEIKLSDFEITDGENFIDIELLDGLVYTVRILR